ncbi:MAG: beta-propeller fold lactonase family protein, partial [Candidatus Aureabacteria bacterium]|nr:beta-propeller fold lactonase family protein [Candidatus Auribacterota bacterium]
GGVMTTVAVGQRPRQVGIVPGGFTAYVTNYADNTVSVINIMTESVTAVIPVGLNPVGVCVASDGRYCYVTNSSADSVSVIECAGNTVVKEIALSGHEPMDIKLSSDGRKGFVVESSSNTVSVIDLHTHEEDRQITVGNYPLHIVLSPFSSTVESVVKGSSRTVEVVNDSKGYVTNSYSGTVSVLNLRTNAVEKEIIVGGAPTGIALSSNGAMAYVVNNGTDSISVIDTTISRTSAEIATGRDPWGIALTMDDAYGMVTNTSDNNVSVISLRSLQTTSKISVGNQPRGIVAQLFALKITPLLDVRVTSHGPQPGDRFRIEVSSLQIDQRFDAYAVVRGIGPYEGLWYSFVAPKKKKRRKTPAGYQLVKNVYPIVTGATLPEAVTVTLLDIPQMPASLVGVELEVIVALVPAGSKPKGVEDAIRGYSDQETVIVLPRE